MTLEQKKKADEAKKLADEKAKKEADEAKKLDGNFRMTVTHLSWGTYGRNHFFNDKKPVINAKVMKGFEETLQIWIDEGWVIKGSYKK